jgi:hypothetical protein
MRRRSATHDDIAGFIAAAIWTGVDPVGKDDAAIEVDHGALGHGAEDRVVQDGVPDTPLRVAHDTVDAGDERELVGAGVVRAVRLRTDARMQAGREDLHDDLVVAMSDGLRILRVPR